MTRIRFEDLPSTNTPRNAENLNKLNNVVISSTEPITGEEVWIQKGKNLLSGIIEGYTLDGNGGITAYNGAYITKFIEVQPNTSYVASGFSNQYKEWYDENFAKISNVTDNPAISPSNAKYLRMNGTGNIGNIQIEQGSTATSYEPYIDKKIHTKNDNDVYEEFYDETNREVYSTTEQRIGTWIDGKPLYRRVFTFTITKDNAVRAVLTGVKEVVNIYGNFSNGTNTFFLNHYIGETPPVFASLWVNNSFLYGYGSAVYDGYVCKAVLEYTKNTD